MTKVSIISIVDDDNSVRESLHSLLRSVGFLVQAFASAEEFLESDHLDKTDCLILDVRMPGMTGVELQRHLKAIGCDIPIIFISAHSDEHTNSLPVHASNNQQTNNENETYGSPINRQNGNCHRPRRASA